MSHAALSHAVNGFFDSFRSKSSAPAVAAQPASRASRVKVESRYNEGDDESLLESATSLPRPTLKALEKSVRADGFKGATVSGWGQGQRGGFTVRYDGQEYEFEISENVSPRPTGEIGRLVKESGRYGQNGRGIYHETAAAKHDMVLHQDHRGRWRIDLVTSAGGNHTDVTGRESGSGPNSGYSSPEAAFQAALDVQRTRGIRGKSHVWLADRDGNLSDYEPMEANGRRTGILSDGTRVNVYQYGDEWTAAIHYPHGGYTSLIMSSPPGTGEPEFDVHNVEGSHMGRLVPWDAAPLNIRRYIEQNVAGDATMVANARGTAVDEDAARELDLYIANTYELVGAPNSLGKSISINLQRKLAAGSYDSDLAPKAWQHLVDEGAKRYQKEFGSGSPIFNAATRRRVAADFARAWEEENQLQRNTSQRKIIEFVLAGDIERWQPSRRSYVWQQGYSEGGNTQPWVTRSEAQASAKSRGARAVFKG